MALPDKYARVEWERRFLLREFPSGAGIVQVRRITDRYIEGTRLRLRRMSDRDGQVLLKLTQKIPEPTTTARRGLITTLRLSEEEFDRLAVLPGKLLSKTRYSVPPFGIDVFEAELEGLTLAEAEFESEDEASALQIPSFVGAEVTGDPRFTGGSLVSAVRDDLRLWLAGYGIKLP